MLNFVYFPLSSFIKTLQKVLPYTQLRSCACILYPNIVIARKLLKYALWLFAIEASDWKVPYLNIWLNGLLSENVIMKYAKITHNSRLLVGALYLHNFAISDDTVNLVLVRTLE